MLICVVDGWAACFVISVCHFVPMLWWSSWDNPSSCVYIAVLYTFISHPSWQHSSYIVWESLFIAPVICITIICQNNSDVATSCQLSYIISLFYIWCAQAFLMRHSLGFCLGMLMFDCTFPSVMLCKRHAESIWLAGSQSVLTLWSLCFWLINHATVISSKPWTLTDTNYHEASLACSETAWVESSSVQVKPTVFQNSASVD